MQLAGVVGTPGGMGGSTLGLGIVLKLHDQFSKQAVRVDRQMKMLGNSSDMFIERMDRGLHAMSAGLGTMAVGAGVLGTLSFPLRDAINFQEAVSATYAITDQGSKYTKDKISQMALEMSSLFDPITVANSLKDTIAAGIDNVEKAGFTVTPAIKLASVTESPLEDMNSILLSLGQTYGYYDEGLTAADTKNYLDRAANLIFEAVKAGRFSDSGLTDASALARQLPKFLAVTKGFGTSIEEVLAIASASTLGGQNAQRAFTGLQQMFSDFSGWEKGKNRVAPWMKFLEDEGVFLKNARGQIDAAAFTRESEGNTIKLISLLRKYVGGNSEEFDKLYNNNESFRQRYDLLQKNIESGKIGKNVKWEDNKLAAGILQEMEARNILDASRLREVVPTIWGSNAAGPLVTSQFDDLVRIYMRMGNVTDELEAAYIVSLDTVKKQWQLLTTSIMKLNITWGSTLLNPVQDTVRAVRILVDVINMLSRRFEWLVQPLLTAATYMGIFLATMGATMAASGGLLALNAFIASNAAESGLFAKIIGGSLSTALWRVTWITVGLIGAQRLLGYVWRNNLFGMADVTRGWVNRLTRIFDGVKELFLNLDWSTGITKISASTKRSLQEMGLYEFTIDLASMLFRLGKFVRGVSIGFTDTMRAYRNMIREIFQGVSDGLAAAGILPKVREWLDNLITPTAENVEAFKQFGITLGRVFAGLTILAGLAGTLTVLTTFSRVLWSVNGGLRGLLLDVAPLAAAVGVLAGAGWLVKEAFDGNWFGFAGFLEQRVPRLALAIKNFDFYVYDFVRTVKDKGFGTAISTLTYRLTGMVPATLVARVKERLTNLGDAIRTFPMAVRMFGWDSGVRYALNKLFGYEQAQVVYQNLTEMRDNIFERFRSIGTYISIIPLLAQSGMSNWDIFTGLVDKIFPQGKFSARLTQLRTTLGKFFTELGVKFEGWLENLGLLKYWNTAKEKFNSFAARFVQGWNNLKNLVLTVWGDIKGEMNWKQLVGEAVVFLSSLVAFAGSVFKQLTASATAFYNSVTNVIDWEQIKQLFADIDRLFSSTGGPASGGRTNGWVVFWDGVAASVNSAVDVLRTAVNLMTRIKGLVTGDKKLAAEAGANLTDSAGSLVGGIVQNPLTGIGGLLLVDILIGRVTKLFGGLGKVTGGFSLLKFSVSRLIPWIWKLGAAMLVTNPIGWALLTAGAINLAVTAWKNDFAGLRTWLTGWWDGLSDQTQTMLRIVGLTAAAVAATLLIAFAPITAIGIALGIATYAWMNNLGGFRDFATALFTNIGITFQNIWIGIANWWNSFMPSFHNKLVDLDKIFKPTQDFIRSLFGMGPMPVTEYKDLNLQEYIPYVPLVPETPGATAPATTTVVKESAYSMNLPTGFGTTWDRQLTVKGADAEQVEALRNQLAQEIRKYKRDDSEGGNSLTKAEQKIITDTLERLILKLDEPIKATVERLEMDGMNVLKVTNRAYKRNTQLGGMIAARRGR